MNFNDISTDLTSPYDKANNEGSDPRCIPLSLTNLPPIGDEIIYPHYSESERNVWSTLYTRQVSFLEERSCEEFLNGLKLMDFSADCIPSLKNISKVLTNTTNWKAARVPGLIRAVDFFDLLRQQIFPSTDYIREENELDYTPAPDLFHDIFGHTPLLTDKNFANFYQKFGIAALKAEGEQKIFLERFHWFTVEFGLIKKPEGMRIYGAGILSSHKEVQHSLSNEVDVRDFNAESIIKQDYQVWHLQPILYAIDSFEQLETGFTDWATNCGLF